MLELLFKSESNLLKHRGVPLLREREDFLVKKQSEGCQTRELQILASLLLKTVNILSFKDKDKSIITLDEIVEKVIISKIRSKSGSSSVQPLIG